MWIGWTASLRVTRSVSSFLPFHAQKTDHMFAACWSRWRGSRARERSWNPHYVRFTDVNDISHHQIF
jgi:hypothetical protein